MAEKTRTRKLWVKGSRLESPQLVTIPATGGVFTYDPDAGVLVSTEVYGDEIHLVRTADSWGLVGLIKKGGGAPAMCMIKIKRPPEEVAWPEGVPEDVFV